MILSYELFYRLAIFNLKDLIEILSITSGLYFFSVWLKQDKQKPLVLYFYSICSLVILANLIYLPTLSNLLSTIFPVVIMLFILIHQRSLQQNFVALKNIQPAQIFHTNWLETLLRSCIIAANNKKPISCLIEGQDSLANLVSCDLIVKAKLEPELLDALVTSNNYDENKMIWLSNTGFLIGLNTNLIMNIKDHVLNNNNNNNKIDNWLIQAIWFTKQTDCLIFRMHQLSKKFDIIIAGKLIENVSMDYAIKLIQKHAIQDLIKHNSYLDRKNYDHQIQKKSGQQLHT